ncbi:hypothetical protein ADT26_18985 [Xanthomonas oryzae]|nr:hypothetical protein AXO1947_11855 [Xanthomonas oryzae pv. oryzae]KOR40010.1 hypothetical protein ADT26_18985 [Xanthomonas oryzae]AUI92436.1 hypothetical protein BVV16_09485 [Xanthomonas oryzae pv. oryzae]AUI96111.1 hypothetical protein BVV17_09495 [Xanthomonas oryzae pv. oryzae]AUI99784.1 hypothetical protein BVV18_09500 [Xanthomonas oryzae pv. oryzae]
MRCGLPVAFGLLPWLARRQGVLHGRKLGFGGTEARSLIADWVQVGRGGRYRAAGAPWDLEQPLGQLRVPIRAVTLARDTVGPAGALRALLDKMPQAHAAHVTLDDRQLGTRSDHFAWMKTPATVVATLRSASDDAINGDRISQRD